VANDPHFFLAAPGGAASVGELSLEPGLVLGNKYRLLRPAGFGGMGAVWVARNEATAAEVVVKVLVTARQGVDQEAIARFRREAHMAAQLYHRGIVRIFDLVELSFASDDFDSSVRHAGSMEGARPPDALVLVMELLRGETLASRMDKKVRFSQEDALAIVLPLLSALAHAHAKGIVHRDLKPENVFLSVDPDGHVIPKILDFGISKLLQPAAPRITTDGAMLGTPSYMSPEQARGLANVDARADVFAAGILLYECIAGENPFASGSYHSVVAAILERDPPVLKMASPEVWRVIKRALEKAPALRYANAGELALALAAAAQLAVPVESGASGAFPARSFEGGDGSVPPAPFREPGLTIPSMRVEGKKRKRARATAAAVAVAVALGVAAGFYTSTRPIRGLHLGGSRATGPASETAGTATPTAETSAPLPAPEVPSAVSLPLPVPTAVQTTTPALADSAPPASPPAPRATPHPATAATHGKGAAPAPSPASAPPVVRGVVRDPGF
jgi:eukaryotic-like serine/threonine-protein kinase